MGIIDNSEPAALDRILMLSMPATLAVSGDTSVASNAMLRDKARASLVRKVLGIEK